MVPYLSGSKKSSSKALPHDFSPDRRKYGSFAILLGARVRSAHSPWKRCYVMRVARRVSRALRVAERTGSIRNREIGQFFGFRAAKIIGWVCFWRIIE